MAVEETTIGDRLSDAIAISGLTAYQVAKATNIGRGYLSRLLSNQIQNPKKYLSVLAAYLNIREEWLTTGRGEGQIKPPNKYQFIVKVFVSDKDIRTGEAHFNYLPIRPADYDAYYFPVATDYFSDHTFLLVEKHYSGGGGIFLGLKDNKHILVIRQDSIDGSVFFNKDSNTQLLGRIALTVILQKGVVIYEH